MHSRQENSASPRTFLHRTDALAAAKGCDVQDLAELLKISRRTMFACRADESKVSTKTLLRLEHAEREAGMVFGAGEELSRAARSAQAIRLMESAGLLEIYRELPEAARKLIAKGKLDGMNSKMLALFMDTDALARAAQELLGKPGSKTTQRELKYFADKVAGVVWPAREVWEACHKLLRERLGLDDDEAVGDTTYNVVDQPLARVAEEKKK